jgi:glycine cleavage system regulatory protein
LVHSVSSALAEIGASIEELDTATSDAPMSGGVLFEATSAVVLPVGVTVSAVRSRLEALADRLMVDIDVVS